MPLPRPYIPTDVRLAVALRQLGTMHPESVIARAHRAGTMIATLAKVLEELAELLGTVPERLHLDHDPALQNRRKIIRLGMHIGYDPPANDPAHLIYRERNAHRIKTLVRGDGAQYSDAALARKNKRIAKNRERGRHRQKIAQRKDFKWPKRRFNTKGKSNVKRISRQSTQPNAT